MSYFIYYFMPPFIFNIFGTFNGILMYSFVDSFIYWVTFDFGSFSSSVSQLKLVFYLLNHLFMSLFFILATSVFHNQNTYSHTQQTQQTVYMS